MAFIRLFKVRGHLGQQFIAGDTDVHGKAKFILNPLPYLAGSGQGLPEEVDGFRHVQEYLINTEFLMVRGVFLQKSHHAPGLGQGFPGGNPVLFGQGGFGQHNPMSHTGVPSNSGRNGAQIQRFRILA